MPFLELNFYYARFVYVGLNYEWQGCVYVPSLSWSLEEGIVNIFPVEKMKLGLVSEIYVENVSARIIYLAQKIFLVF